MSLKKKVSDIIDSKSDLIEEAHQKIWDYAELAFEETKSVDLYKELFTKEGFNIESNLDNIPTAFKATYGSGKPVIALLGEYDALPNLSQEGGVSKQSPIVKGDSGHGCGHNSLGSASFGAALAVKEYMIENNLDGTIEYYGCPAEENGNAKTFMARDGIFDNVDAAFTWHPGANNAAWSIGSLANVSVAFHFKGVASHAAAAPHLGRSALDTAEIMSVGVNYLREHIIPEARIHYAYLDVGGKAPNVVQESSTVHYYIRAPKSNQVQEIYKRVQDIAKGAALICGTEVEIEFYTGLSDFIPNKTLTTVLHQAMEDVGAPDFDEKDYKIAREFFNTIGESEKNSIIKNYGANIVDKPLDNRIAPLQFLPIATPGSTDVGDVSYVVPTAQLTLATVSLGTAPHTWQMTAQGNTSIALKGTLTAANMLAIASINILENPELIKEAKSDLENDTGGEYISPLPDHIKPMI